ncbi:MAG: PilZ domain-containing protein [Vicinamibacteria bacterium]
MTERAFPRHRVTVPLYISMGGDFLHKSIPLESKDVSGGGISFETTKQIPLEAESSVIVARLGDLGKPAFIHGRVVHSEKNPATDKYIVGLQFTGFVNTTREELLARIEAWRG